MQAIGGGLGLFLIFLAVGAVQIYGGFVGIEYHFGTGWAWGAIAVGMVFRLMLPLTIGTFFWCIGCMGMALVWRIISSCSRIIVRSSRNGHCGL